MCRIPQGAHGGQEGHKVNRMTSRGTCAEWREAFVVKLKNLRFGSVRSSRSQGRACSRLHTTARVYRNGGQDGAVEVGSGNDESHTSRVPGGTDPGRTTVHHQHQAVSLNVVLGKQLTVKTTRRINIMRWAKNKVFLMLNQVVHIVTSLP